MKTKEEMLQKAAQAWCRPATSHLIMQPELAEAFAEMLEETWQAAQAEMQQQLAGISN